MEQLKVGDRVRTKCEYIGIPKGVGGIIKGVTNNGHYEVRIDKGLSDNDNYAWLYLSWEVEKEIEPNSFETQIKQVFTHLQDRPITSWEAINTYRITRLSAVIHELRKNNTITSVWEDNGKVGKEKKRWTKYTLIK